MKALDRKLLRDLWHMRGQVFAIALVLAAATATFVLSLGVHRSLVETRDAYYARNAFAESLELGRQLRASLGDSPRVLRDLSFSLERIGDIEKTSGNLAAAQPQRL